MAQNLLLDPTKKDYVVTDGSPSGSDRVHEKCYYALLIPQGKWLYGVVGQGSLLYTLPSQKRSGSLEQTFAQYTTDAIKRQVINVGDATAVSVKNLQATRTGTSNEIDVVPANKQLSSQLNFNPV